ncbi:MAG: hypothetical protein B6243_11930 [Anaerolineaceae bacterium 4572_5.2]|nr:MAG: hypothetical protein B6243_11930 [Anaerolineaceae bacterium 4572_5.2]
MIPLSRRERLRAATIDEIKTIAHQQMAEKGAATLSLRAIAREMGMTSPALYRYFASRDDLVTALIVDAYNSLADAMEAARSDCPPNDYRNCLLAIGLAYRDWALAHSQDYALVFGAPIPGYHAPKAITEPPAKRSMRVFITILATAAQAGKLHPTPAYANPPAKLQAQLLAWAKKYSLPPLVSVLYLALAGWSRLHGLVELEIFGHIDHVAKNAAELYRGEVLAFIEQAGIA